MSTPSTRSLAILLAMLIAVAPFAIDMYLPAMKIMADDLSTSIHYVEISISTFLLGYALGQLLGGPLSDRFGRKPLIALGLTLFSITSLMLTQTENIDQLLLLRALQAIGGGIATVNSSAVIRDLFAGDEMAKVLSMVAIVMMAAPLLAPVIGSFIISYFSWQVIFYSLAVYALTVLLLLFWKLPETNAAKQKRVTDAHQNAQPLSFTRLWQSYKKVLTHRQAMGYVMAISFSFSGMFVFITASAFAYMEYFSISPQVFPFIFGGNVLLMMLMNRVNVWALNHYSSTSILTTGLIIQILCGAGLIIASYLEPNLYMIVALVMVFVGSIGLVAANATAGTLNFFPDISGTATAVIGVSEFTLGALMGILWSLLHEFQFSVTQHHSLSPMAWVMTGCVVIGFLGFSILSRPKIES